MKRIIILFTFLLSCIALDLMGLSRTTSYDGTEIKVAFNTGIYERGLSDFSRSYEVWVDGNSVGTYTGALNQSFEHTVKLVTDPEPHKTYEIRIQTKNPDVGLGCDDRRNKVVDDVTYNTSVSGLSGLSASVSDDDISLTWSKGDITTDRYELKIYGNSISDPEGYQLIETIGSISGSSTSRSLNNRARGIDYKFELTQETPGGDYTSTIEDVDVLLGSWDINSVAGSARSSDIRLTISHSQAASLSGKYDIDRRTRSTIGAGTYSSYTSNYASITREAKLSNTYDDESVTDCHEYQYRVSFRYERGDFSQRIHTLTTGEVGFPGLTASASPPTAVVVSTPDICDDPVEITWEDPAVINDCQDYWYIVDRYELDAGSSIITTSKTTIVDEGNSPTALGGEYSFTDNSSKDEGTTYRYSISHHTRWPNGNEYSSTAVSGDQAIGSSITYSGTVTADVDLDASVTIKWQDIANEDSYKVIRRIDGVTDHVFDELPQNST